MEREKTKLYKKIGGGLHRFKKKTYKKGETFRALPSEISDTHRPFIIEIAEEEIQEETVLRRKVNPKVTKKELIETEDANIKEETEVNTDKPYMETKGAWSKVYLKDGTQAHDGSLRKKAAQELLDSLLED